MHNVLTITEIRERARLARIGTVELARAAGVSPTTINRIVNKSRAGTHERAQVRTLSKLTLALVTHERHMLAHLVSLHGPAESEAA